MHSAYCKMSVILSLSMMHINEEMFCQMMEQHERCNKRVIEQLYLINFLFHETCSLFPLSKMRDFRYINMRILIT
jgi:hypothetical protein